MLDIINKLLYSSLFSIRNDMKQFLMECLAFSKNSIEKRILELYLDNEHYGKKSGIPLCQDTGLVSIFLSHDIASQLDLLSLKENVQQYMKTLNMRNSQIISPLERVNLNNNQIPFIKVIDFWSGKIGVQVSGAGSELQGFVVTFSGSTLESEIIATLVKEILPRFSKACPPVTIGIGMGGTMVDATLMSKIALFRNIGQFNENPVVASLEKKLLTTLREKSDRGAQGVVGGKCGVAHVSIETVSSHIAGFHVAVSFQCYLTRSWIRDV